MIVLIWGAWRECRINVLAYPKMNAYMIPFTFDYFNLLFINPVFRVPSVLNLSDNVQEMRRNLQKPKNKSVHLSGKDQKGKNTKDRPYSPSMVIIDRLSGR